MNPKDYKNIVADFTILNYFTFKGEIVKDEEHKDEDIPQVKIIPDSNFDLTFFITCYQEKLNTGIIELIDISLFNYPSARLSSFFISYTKNKIKNGKIHCEDGYAVIGIYEGSEHYYLNEKDYGKDKPKWLKGLYDLGIIDEDDLVLQLL